MTYLLTFMYLFAFKIFSVIDSAMLVGLGFLIYFLVKKEYRQCVLKNIKSKYVLWALICGVVLLIWCILTLVINKSFDLTYIKTLVHLALSLGIGIFLISYFDYKKKMDSIVNNVLIAFTIQSCLQWIFFLLPEVSELFNVFRTEAMIENNIKYHGFRGIAIASSAFFSLSASYGLMAILFFTKHNTLFNKNIVLKLLLFLVMISGTFFAGRTGFIGIAFALILVIVNCIKNRKTIFVKENKKQFIAISILFLVFILFIVVTMNIPYFFKFYEYVFELFTNIFSGKGFNTTSTDQLFDMFDVDMSLKTYFIGDGKYTVNTDSSHIYYMGTDVGYLRKILYFGIPGLILSAIVQLVLFGKKRSKKEILFIFIYFLVLEIKGEIIGLNIMINSIILMYAFQSTKKGEEEYVKLNSSNDDI